MARQRVRVVAPLLIMALVAGSCGGDDDGTDPDDPAPVPSTAPAATTSTTAVVTDTTSPPTPDPTTAPADASGARFALSSVGLGVLSQVIVENVGNEPGSLAGYWLCQRPAYFELPDVELQPGELAAVAVNGRDEMFGPPSFATAIEGVATIGPFDPTGGEVGLYLGNEFANPDTIVSYVEWGSSGHGRSATAVGAQIWPAGGFVETSAETGTISATVIPPTDPAHWTSG